ncbi:THO complex subunit 6 [Boothiomyces sp. JEL0866]|nr:THO complex subunit 6 [Boothiomyces sp. JEL0866]
MNDADSISGSSTIEQRIKFKAAAKKFKNYTTKEDSPLHCVAATGSHIYAGDSVGVIYEWNIAEDAPSRLLVGHSKKVTNIVAGKTTLFSTSEDASVKIWDLTTGTCTRTIMGHSGSVLSICLNYQGKLFTGGQDKTINEWDPRTGRRKWIMTGSKGSILCLASSITCPDRLFSGGNDNIVRSWDTSSGRCIQTFEGHEGAVLSIAINDGFLYSAGRDGVIHMWHSNDGSLLQSFAPDDFSAITSIIFIGRTLYSANESMIITQWDTQEQIAIASYKGHKGPVLSLSALENGSSQLVSCSTDSSVKVWKTESQTTPQPFSPPTCNILLTVANAFYSRPASISGSQFKRNSSQSIVSDAESHQSLQEQLHKAQEIINKQERNKLRLKGELSGTKSELNLLKNELAEVKRQLALKNSLSEELEAAKEMLINYNTELQTAQEAYRSSLHYMFRNCDTQLKRSAFEISTVYKLVNGEYGAMLGKSRKEQKIIPDRVWDFDSDWDSDCDIPEDKCWWRKAGKSEKRLKNISSAYFIPTIEKETTEEPPIPDLQPVQTQPVLKQFKISAKKSLSNLFMGRLFGGEESKKEIAPPQLPSPAMAEPQFVSQDSDEVSPVSDVKIKYKKLDPEMQKKRHSTVAIPVTTTESKPIRINRNSMIIGHASPNFGGWLNPVGKSHSPLPEESSPISGSPAYSPSDSLGRSKRHSVKVNTAEVYRFENAEALDFRNIPQSPQSQLSTSPTSPISIDDVDEEDFGGQTIARLGRISNANRNGKIRPISVQARPTVITPPVSDSEEKPSAKPERTSWLSWMSSK